MNGCLLLLGVVGLISVAGAESVESKQSTVFELDTSPCLTSDSNRVFRVSYDTQWMSDDPQAEIVISADGNEVARRTGNGEIEWSPRDYGTYVLTCQTLVGGVAVGETYSTTIRVVNAEGMGLPGLQRVTFTGSAYDASNVALGAEPIVTLTGEGMYDASLGAQSTYAYAGYMYFRENETYTFRGNFDDYSSVLVDNAEVVAQHTGDKSGSIGPFAESGWHKVDFRVSNNGGASGGGFGIQYQTDKDQVWHKIVDDGSGTCLRTGPDYCGVVILKAAMRPSDPTIMDVVYKVQSPKEKVSVRALAYENGNRSFANAVPVLTFADGTGVNIGDDITANEEHTLSWQVAADWATDLTKVRFEVMVMDEGLLPLHFVTIPKTANHAAIQYSDTVLSSTAVVNALFWLYAGLDDDLSLSNGRLSGPFGELANGSNVSNPAQTVSWLYQKMGYSTLTGANLNYVNSAARINLTPSGLRQFAVKTIK